MKKRVLVGMHGGVDSGVVAMLLKQQGFEVIGITLIFDEKHKTQKELITEIKEFTRAININHVTVDLRSEFNKTVIGYFIDSYRKAETPFPCAVCNPNVKFPTLFN